MRARVGRLLPTVATLLATTMQLSAQQGEPSNVIKGRFPEPPHDRWDVFVSYCARDRHYWKRIEIHLTPMCREGVKIYSYDMVEPGVVIRDEARSALLTSVVAILLISVDYLASDLMDHELPDLLEQAEHRDARILTLQVGNCDLSGMERLTRYQRVGGAEASPLNRLRQPKQDDIYIELLKVIKRRLVECNRDPKPLT
jgi:internalin A